jgi:hypothetical protein
MELITLDRSASFRRFPFRRIGFPVLVLGICAYACLTPQAAPGQAQIGAAESTFDQGPENVPARTAVPIPPPPAPLPFDITKPGVVTMGTPAEKPLRPNTPNKSRLATRKKNPDGTLTARR